MRNRASRRRRLSLPAWVPVTAALLLAAAGTGCGSGGETGTATAPPDTGGPSTAGYNATVPVEVPVGPTYTVIGGGP